MINLNELDNILRVLDDTIASHLEDGGFVDQRFSGANILINMLFEKNQGLSKEMATLTDEVKELKSEAWILNRRMKIYMRNHKKLVLSHQDLKRQVESNIIAIHQKIDELALDFQKLKI